MRVRGSILVLLLGAAPVVAQQPAAGGAPPITAGEIDGHLRFLASDLLEGRAPATRGGRLATEYIASELRAYGLKPGNGDSYLQELPIELVTLQPRTLRVAASGKATAALKQPDDVVVWAGSPAAESSAKGELVFVGYGAKAPEYRWDDFKGMDLKGKILLVLVNDPPATAKEPSLFGGKAMTYYGRWTYKFEEAERQGAAGALIVHTTERAGYPWHTVVGSWSEEQRMLPRPADAPAPLAFRGWVTDSAATALLKQAGLDLAKLRKQAESRSFKPVATGITMDVGFRNDVAHLKSENVVGIVPGTDPKLKDTYVVLSSHWDHFGIGPVVDGDSIYNGALDNASGVSDLLAVARAAAQGAPTPRSLLFAFVTAEESGLLGSQYFAEHPTVPLASLVANVNVDGGNLLGRVNDLVVLGQDKSSLGAELLKLISPDGMRFTPEEHPEAGYFYRSDHFSFAKQGVPSVSIGEGYDFVGKPAGWGKAQEEDYTAHRYHQPSDAYRPDFDLTGAVQLSDIVLGFARQLASSPTLPTWAPTAEFKRKAEPVSQ
ncbi:MAG TPA: M28 family peptidase [Longimicrobiales bacterium]|nr:M28 family peptidase [Longimicrobiales bacterium]